MKTLTYSLQVAAVVDSVDGVRVKLRSVEEDREKARAVELECCPDLRFPAGKGPGYRPGQKLTITITPEG